jgi:hypothetical protein
MKTIDATGLARRYASAQRVAWLLELSVGNWTWRGATLATALDENAYPARLGAVERWREWLPERGREGGRARAEAKVRVPDLPGETQSLRAQLEVRPPVGIEAVLRLAWLDVQGTADPSAAAMLRGRLTDWQLGATGVTLTLNDELEAIGGRRIGRLLRPGMAGGLDSEALGQALPWIFGALRDAELVPLRSGAVTRLAEAIDALAGVIPVVSLVDFPNSGVAQIGAEPVFYKAIDPAAVTLGTPAQPVIRVPDATLHPAGAVARALPAGGLLWLVADHPCRSVSGLLADGMPAPAGDWQAEVTTLGGQTVQTVRMSKWPLNEDGKPARRLSARVEGLTDATNALIENPARVIETLLTHGRLGRLEESRIDGAGIDALAGELEARDFRFARRVSGTETLGALLDGAAEEAGLWIQATDPIGLVAADPNPHAEVVSEALDEGRLLAVKQGEMEGADVRAPVGFVPPDAVELVGTAPTPESGRPSWVFPPEALDAGKIPRRYLLQWLDVGETEAAGDLGELLWRRLSEPPFFHRQPYPIGATLLSCGDTVRLTDPPVELFESLGWVRAIEAGEAAGGPARARLEAWGPWAGSYCWKQDLQNNLRRFSFGAHLLMVLAGRPVALLTRDGTLRIRGRLRERASIGGAMSEPIDVAGGWLRFGVGAGGSFAPFMRIDTDGNAELTGTARERTTLTIDPGGVCHGADANRFWLSSDSLNGALEWRADTETLYLPGILIERVRL